MARTINIDVNFNKKYNSNLQLLTQLKGGKFMGKCREETMSGEEEYFDQLGSITAAVRDPAVSQFPDSPETVIAHDRRKVVATAYDCGLFIDRIDKVQTLIDPEGKYVQQQRNALNRKRDIEFFSGALGTAATGKAGGTAVPFTDCPVVDVATGDTGSTGMNLEKLQNALFLLEESGVDVEDPNDQPYLVWTPRQKMELLQSTEAVSSDYTNVKALINGQIDSFYGFKFITSNLVPYVDTAGTGLSLDWSAVAGEDDAPVDTDTTDVRGCFAYTKNNIIQTTNPDLVTEIEKRADKSFDWYAYCLMRTGAVRMEEKKTIFVPCDQSPA